MAFNLKEHVTRTLTYDFPYKETPSGVGSLTFTESSERERMDRHFRSSRRSSGFFVQSLGEAMFFRIEAESAEDRDEDLERASQPQITRNCVIYSRTGEHGTRREPCIDPNEHPFQIFVPDLRSYNNPLAMYGQGFAFEEDYQTTGGESGIRNARRLGNVFPAPDGTLKLSTISEIWEDNEGRESLLGSPFSNIALVRALTGGHGFATIWAMREESLDRLNSYLQFLTHNKLEEILSQDDMLDNYVVCPAVLGAGRQKQRILLDGDTQTEGFSRYVRDIHRKHNRR